jgi:hypothetical protein
MARASATGAPAGSQSLEAEGKSSVRCGYSAARPSSSSASDQDEAASPRRRGDISGPSAPASAADIDAAIDEAPAAVRAERLTVPHLPGRRARDDENRRCRSGLA